MKKRLCKVVALAMGVLLSAFLMPTTVYASDGSGGVDITLPEGWQTKEWVSQVTPFEYSNGKIKVYAKTVSASFNDGAYLDITDTMQVSIKENGKLSVRVEYSDGNVSSDTFVITNFDLERPSISARVDGEVMYLSAKDEISGVKSIAVNGKVFEELKDGQMCIDIKELETKQEYFTVYAKDVAGNLSKTYKVKNPYYVGEVDAGNSDKSLTNPQSVEATDPTSAKGSVTDYTTDKEFYTITADEKTFYLVIDNSMSQENVYLLTEASSNDLLNFVDYNGVDVENGDIPLYEFSEEVADTSSDVTTKEVPQKTEKKMDSSVFLVLIIAVSVGGGYYFVKKKKQSEELDEAEEMDVYDLPDDEEEIGDSIEYVNGDEDED